MNILMVLTSHVALGNTGKKTGFWLEEFAAPYYVLSDAGATITLASPKGGQPPLDPKSDEADIRAFCEQHLGRYKTPKLIRFVTELPRGPSGKVQRLKLLEI